MTIAVVVEGEFVPWMASSPGARAMDRAVAILRTLAVSGTRGAKPPGSAAPYEARRDGEAPPLDDAPAMVTS